MRSISLSIALLVAMTTAAPALAGPKVTLGKKAVSSPVYRGKATTGPRKTDATGLRAPSVADRNAVAASLLGKPIALDQVVWAAVSPRAPFVNDRAALAFLGATSVDPLSGWAKFSVGGGLFGSEGALTQGELDGLFDAIGAEPMPRGMELWIHADAGKKYVATCRVRLQSSVGDVAVNSEGGFSLTSKIDHTGKSFGKVSFLVDPPAAGWYAFSIAATTQGWSTSGCWVDEV